MNYGAKLKELRIENNLSQKDVADKLGIARITYNHYEIQEKIIPIERLVDLAKFYQVSIDYLFGIEPIKKKNSCYTINRELSKKRLKEFRKRDKITQQALAQKLNISRTTITEYERGTNIIATAFLYTIANTYHISADYLLGLTF